MSNEEKLRLVIAKQTIEERHFEFYAKLKGITKYEFTPTSAGYDVKFRSGNTLAICESKVRPEPNSFFLKYGPFLEELKADRIEQAQQSIFQDKGIQVLSFYFNFTKDSIQIFRLKPKDKYTFFEWLLPKSHMEPKKLIQKSVTKLFYPEETILLEGLIDEETYLYINSSGEE